MNPKMTKTLTELFEIKNNLVKCNDINELADKSLSMIRNKLQTQIASLFLFNKDGKLQRIRINGIDKDGKKINNNWFRNEMYNKGDSFTGKTVLPALDTKYGLPQLSNNLGQDEINTISYKKYKDKLGSLNCAIAVPLNGEHISFGAVEVINKLSNKVSSFSSSDIYWLSVISINVSNFITKFRIRNEFKVLSSVSNMLVEKPITNTKQDCFYTNILKKIISPSTNYKACILRQINNNGMLVPIARFSTDDISWKKRNDEPITRGCRYPGHALNGQIVKVYNIDEKKKRFYNYDWVYNNDLKSYACIPLSFDGKVVGTLSVFTGFYHEFYETDINFLKNIASLFAIHMIQRKYEYEMEKNHIELEKLRDKANMSSRKLLYSNFYDFKHNIKNEYINMINSLKSGLDATGNKRRNVIFSQIQNLQKKVDKLSEELKDFNVNKIDELDTNETVSVNNILNKLIRYFSKEQRYNDINFESNFDTDIPLISISQERLNSVLFNVITNAINAIEKTNRKCGSINISTKVITIKSIEYIECLIEDDGVGIKNENMEIVFNSNFTNYKSGSGVGLPLTKKYLNSFGGKIQLDSTVGKGTKVQILLPWKRLQ